jgi:FkbM family methyltransferase
LLASTTFSVIRFTGQAYSFLDSSPKLVVDCGAHLGHFSLLLEMCVRSKFGSADTEYLVIEPNPYLVPRLRESLKLGGILERSTIYENLLGKGDVAVDLWIDKKNFLESSLYPRDKATPHTILPLNLDDLLAGRDVDVLKIDIEGAEYELFQDQLEFLGRTRVVLLEMHKNTLDKRKMILDKMEEAGLLVAMRPIKSHGQELIVFKR